MNPDGTDVRWLGSIGAVADLKYAYTLPGGASSMSCTLLAEPNQRPSAINIARTVKIYRGGSCVWRGKLAEPQTSTTGWSISAIGVGALGANFVSHYSTWSADDPINQAIGRGLPWINPGLAGTPGLWLSQKEDDASQSVTDFLTLLCTNGALTWYVDQSGTLRIIPIPTTPTRILVSTEPASRTVVADVNSLFVRYQATADNTSSSSSSTAAAAFGTVLAVNQASIDAHGVMEAYADLSSVGVMSSTTAQNAGKAALAKYVRATYAGPFTIRQGQWLNLGGAPIDIGAERGIPQVAQLMLTVGGYGGEVVPGTPTFPLGQWEYDDTAQTASVTPFQSIASDLSSLLAAMFPAKPTTDTSTAA
jgi:hypothetical protein